MSREILYPNRKIIPLIGNQVSISKKLMPIGSSKYLSRLRGIRQTSFINRVFPFSTHDRYSHSLDVFNFVNRLIMAQKESWMFLQEKEHLLCAYALVHDIGHAAFSHFAELLEFHDGLGKIDHKKIGIDTVRKMESEESVFSRAGIDLNRIINMMQKQDALYQLVTGPLTSADKLVYLTTDAILTGKTYHPWTHSEIVSYMVPVLNDGSLDKIVLDWKVRLKAEQLAAAMMAKLEFVPEVIGRGSGVVTAAGLTVSERDMLVSTEAFDLDRPGLEAFDRRPVRRSAGAQLAQRFGVAKMIKRTVAVYQDAVDEHRNHLNSEGNDAGR